VFAPLRPALGVVREGEGQDGVSAAVEDDRVVMILRPVEAGEVGELCERMHGLGFPFLHRWLAGRLADITTLRGWSSLRRWGRSHRAGRCSELNLREVSDSGPSPARGDATGGRLIPRRKVCRGQVIHRRRRGRAGASPSRRLNNLGTHISDRSVKCSAQRRSSRRNSGSGRMLNSCSLLMPSRSANCWIMNSHKRSKSSGRVSQSSNSMVRRSSVHAILSVSVLVLLMCQCANAA
jgi:hypothetical protein